MFGARHAWELTLEAIATPRNRTGARTMRGYLPSQAIAAKSCRTPFRVGRALRLVGMAIPPRPTIERLHVIYWLNVYARRGLHVVWDRRMRRA